jgi:hypothetical protein
MIAALNGQNYFSDAVAQDDLGAAPWSGRDAAQWNGADQPNGRRSRKRDNLVDDFNRALFGF